jgi:hypothetical protein
VAAAGVVVEGGKMMLQPGEYGIIMAFPGMKTCWLYKPVYVLSLLRQYAQ